MNIEFLWRTGASFSQIKRLFYMHFEKWDPKCIPSPSLNRYLMRAGWSEKIHQVNNWFPPEWNWRHDFGSSNSTAGEFGEIKVNDHPLTMSDFFSQLFTSIFEYSWEFPHVLTPSPDYSSLSFSLFFINRYIALPPFHLKLSTHYRTFKSSESLPFSYYTIAYNQSFGVKGVCAPCSSLRIHEAHTTQFSQSFPQQIIPDLQILLFTKRNARASDQVIFFFFFYFFVSRQEYTKSKRKCGGNIGWGDAGSI